MTNNAYLAKILNQYQMRNLSNYSNDIYKLHDIIKNWAGDNLLEIITSGSRAKNTAIHLASDVDYLISLNTNTILENRDSLGSIFNSLYMELTKYYDKSIIRKQNVSIRINLSGLEVDITPARKYADSSNDHSLYIYKQNTWRKTNIEKHINDITYSSRTSEIKLLKIWRELHKIDFTSIYLEYLIIKLLYGKHYNDLENNFLYVLQQLSVENNNILFSTLQDPANSNNYLSDSLDNSEKQKIINQARNSINSNEWTRIIW